MRRNIYQFLVILSILSVYSFPHADTTISKASDSAYAWLADMQDSTGKNNGFVDSYEDFWSDGSPVTRAYTYDQAVAAIAFAVHGDTARSRKILMRMDSLQDTDGAWCNSYWYNNFGGDELRKHAGPAMWMALAVMNFEKITGDTSFHSMAIKAIDWCLAFKQTNGAIAGGRTTWNDASGNWTDETWSSTEHNIDAYAALAYFAQTTTSKSTAYSDAAEGVKNFLDNVEWDSVNNRFFGGYKNSNGSIDFSVPLDVNPWAVLSLGLTGTHDYKSCLDYVENADGSPATLATPRYRYTLKYEGDSITAYDFDWEGDSASAGSDIGGGILGPDIWFEGSCFMSCAYRLSGDTVKADEIIRQIIKKQGKDGSKRGGMPYSLNATNNNYWLMTNTNCVSSAAWLVIAATGWNPFTGEKIPANTAIVRKYEQNSFLPQVKILSVKFSGKNELRFNAASSGTYDICIYDISGKRVFACADRFFHAGLNSIRIRDIAPGMYIVNIGTGAGFVF